MKTEIRLPKGGCIKIANDGCGVAIDAPEVQIEGDMDVISAARSTEPRPFDLAAAKAGAPLVTRDGRKAHFLAYCEQASVFKVCAIIEGQGMVGTWTDDGRFTGDRKDQNRADLFMAPKPKRTRRTKYANLYVTHLDGHTLNEWRLYDTASYAGDIALTVSATTRAVALAVPVEVEE